MPAAFRGMLQMRPNMTTPLRIVNILFFLLFIMACLSQNAWSCACQVPIRVVYLDRSTGAAMAGVGYDSAAINHHDFVPDSLGESPTPVNPRVHVLYRPGHYDILYPLTVTAANSTQIASC